MKLLDGARLNTSKTMLLSKGQGLILPRKRVGVIQNGWKDFHLPLSKKPWVFAFKTCLGLIYLQPIGSNSADWHCSFKKSAHACMSMRTQNLKPLKYIFCWNKSKRGEQFVSSLTNLCFFLCSPPFSKSHKTGCSCPTALKCRRSLRHTNLSGLSPVSVIEFQDPNPLLPTSMMTSAIWNQNGVAFLGLSQSLMPWKGNPCL